jgi:hypothetical protein
VDRSERLPRATKSNFFEIPLAVWQMIGYFSPNESELKLYIEMTPDRSKEPANKRRFADPAEASDGSRPNLEQELGDSSNDAFFSSTDRNRARRRLCDPLRVRERRAPGAMHRGGGRQNRSRWTDSAHRRAGPFGRALGRIKDSFRTGGGPVGRNPPGPGVRADCRAIADHPAGKAVRRHPSARLSRGIYNHSGGTAL